MPKDTKIGLTDNGYTSDDIAYDYLEHFHLQTRKYLKGTKRVLLFDGHGSHLTYEFVRRAHKWDIIIFCLIAHSTHACQPLDVVAFRQAKHHHSRQIEDAIRGGKSCFNKYDFLRVFQEVRKLTFTKANIISAWKQAGINPMDPDVVLKNMKLINNEQEHEKEDPMAPREYNPDPDNPNSRAILVPASNQYVSREVLLSKSIFEPPSSPPLRSMASIDEDDYVLDTDQLAFLAESFPNKYSGILEAQEEPTLPPIRRSNTQVSHEYGDTIMTDPDDPSWYHRTPFLNTPYGTRGITNHGSFLRKHEHEMSSPSRRRSLDKYIKGTSMMALEKGCAVERLRQINEQEVLAQESPFVDARDLNKHVTLVQGGRVISIGEGLRNMKTRRWEEDKTELELANERVAAALRAKKVVEDKEAKKKEREDKKKAEQDAKDERKRERDDAKAKKDKEKQDKEAQKEQKKREKEQLGAQKARKREELIAQGKKPRGRRPKVKSEAEAIPGDSGLGIDSPGPPSPIIVAPTTSECAITIKDEDILVITHLQEVPEVIE